jgi:hypothetical protein
MTMDLAKHPYFEPWTDPASGVTSYLLKERVAPIQKGLYYVTPSVSADGRWLWFSAAFPPSHQAFLAAACLDPADPRIRSFPATARGGNPLVLPEGDAVHVPIEDGIWRLAFDGTIVPVLRMPAEIIAGRRLFSLVTDLTVSADGRYFALDSHIGNRWLVSLGEVATGRVTPLRWFAACHHHAAFSPVDPDLMLVNQGPWNDPITGDKFDMNVRMWLMDTRLTRYEPLFGDLWFGRNCQSCHEWWTADGRICWCDYDRGVFECDPNAVPRTRTLVWPRPMWHGQCDPSGRYFCGDQYPYHRTGDKPCRVFFFDRRAGRDVAIVSAMRLPDLPHGEWRPFHLDPHPHFSPDGRFVVYTTTARGTVDVAIAPVEGVLARL